MLYPSVKNLLNCAVEYVLEQFSDEDEDDDAQTDPTNTAGGGGGGGGGLCMETSFGVENDEPRTRVLCSMQAEYRLSLQLVPGVFLNRLLFLLTICQFSDAVHLLM